MAISVSTTPQDYVPEADRSLPDDWKTTFRIRPKTAAMESRIVSKYALARESRGGKEKVDAGRLHQAEIAAFCEIVEAVTNFFVRADSLDSSSKEAQMFGIKPDTKLLTHPSGTEVYALNGEDHNQLAFIASRMEADLRKEIDEASEKQSRLDEGTTKK